MTSTEFLTGGGEMGALIRAHDWSVTPIGAPASWPQPLKTVVGILLAANQPMFVAWGPERICLYNDAYAAILGNKHPEALGRDLLDIWHEIRSDLLPIVAEAYAGQPVHMADIEFVMHRRGYAEETHFAFSYTPIRDEAGEVGGFFCPCTETTGQVLAERRLAAETERQRRLFERAPGFITILSGPDHVFEFINQTYARLFGDRGFIGKTVREAFPELESQGFYELLDQVYTTGERYVAHQVPLTLQSEPGVEAEQRFLDFIYEPVRDDAGEVTGIFCEGHDVTDVRLAAEALRESEERSRRIIEGVKDYSVFTTDMEGNVLDWTPGARAIFGWAAEEIIGRSSELLFTPEDTAAGVPARELAAAREKGCANDERWHVRRDGSRFFANGSVRPLHDAHGEVAGFIKIARDETDRRAVEAKLRASEEFNRRVLASSADCIKVLGMDARLEFMSDGGMSVMEVEDFGAIEGAWWPGFWTGEGHDQALAAVEDAKQGGTGRFQGFATTMKGTPRWWDVIVTPITGPDGRPEKLLSISRDVTATKEAELRLRDLNETLEQRVQERTADLLKAQDALRQSQKMEAMGQLTGGVAHDFNNLLTPIVGSLDMLQRKGLGGPREQRLIDGALQSADKAKTLVQRLLAFARRQPLQAEAVDVGTLVSGMADLVASTTGPQINVVVDVAQDLPPAKADPNQLEMAILNLSVNARDAMPERGTLRIAADQETVTADHPADLRPGCYVRLSVADTGTGMDEATIARSIEPFFSTKGIGKGTGLGLSMVHGLASQLGGGLLISSKPGLGTNVIFWLPVAEGPALVLEKPAASVSPSKKAGLVLLVDDEDLGRASTADMLSELGYQVAEASSAEQAVALVEEGLEPDLLVTDHLMPGMTGTELAGIFRRRWPEKPVLLISGYAEDEGIARNLPRLTKPFRQTDLAASITALEPAGVS